MHPEAISNTLWGLLRRLSFIPEMNFTYLGGGTALSLQLGHRKSEDLDFFLTDKFDDLSFMKGIQQSALDTLVINQTRNHTQLMIQSTKVDLIQPRVPLKFPLKTIHSETGNLKMADARDIGQMKIIAIGSRGSKKDFVDLYCLTRGIIPLESLVAMAMEQDRGISYSKFLFLKGLVDFEEADLEGDVSMIWDKSWEEIKNSLKEEVKKIARKTCKT